jgi:hypothetical protein
MAGVPYIPPRECEDAEKFFKRMGEMDEKIAKVMNDAQQKRAERFNRDKPDQPPLTVGSRVWYKRPEGSGDKMDSRWLGPALVKAREGADSYRVEVKPGFEISAPRKFLKAYREEFAGRKQFPLYYFQRTESDVEASPEEWEVEFVVKHRVVAGKIEFLPKWKGYPLEESVWEPVGNFFHRYSAPLIEYCQKHGFVLDVAKYLKAEA